MFKRLLRAFGFGRITAKRETAIRLGAGDDYDWELYNQTYRGEILKIGKSYTLQITSDDYLFQENRLSLRPGCMPLHPNHRLLYETILQLNPKTVAELGCGGGDHVRNLSTLLPGAKIYGYDRAQKQLDYVHERSPELRAEVRQMDITMPLVKGMPIVDVCYTQAVIMHIQAANSHMVALSNLFHMATQQVLLMENWSRHRFLSDIQYLYGRGMLPWDRIHFYCRRAPELNNRPHLMIISRVPLPYEQLETYDKLHAA